MEKGGGEREIWRENVYVWVVIWRDKEGETMGDRDIDGWVRDVLTLKSMHLVQTIK